MVTFKVDNLKEMKSELKVFSDFLHASGVGEDGIFRSKLISCELITNVIRHGGEEAQFTGNIEGKNIVIKVSAGSLKNIDTDRVAPDVFAESGRGLFIVKTLCKGNIINGDGEIIVTVEM